MDQLETNSEEKLTEVNEKKCRWSSTQQVIVWRDDIPHADCGGSMSVCRRMRSPHSSGSLA